ncbi:MAG: aminoglycoside phosphotransferase family protein [Chthoniobacter sp.]|uniref:phosphotransferase family protein n=1 Tax=Chthoniobacter sp. TaxID=2510640 RepID=UPI0032A7FBD9
MNEESAAFLKLLRQEGTVHDPAARLTALTGGVSCEIYLVEDGAERFVVKRALAKLKVKEDWFADVSRNRNEWEFIRYVAGFLPDAVPALRKCSATGNYFAMEYLGGNFQNWKQLLLKGQAEYAGRAGALLGEIHRRSTGDAEASRVFDTTPNFFQLRIEAYLLATGARHPKLRPLFEAEAERLGATRECLVHGDFSPKNVLVSPERMVLLDCEVAWYGDPAFDLAFMLNHFLLKALYHRPREVGVRRMVDEFWSAYQSTSPAPDLAPRVGRLLLMLLLARVDGKSPAEYLDAVRQDFVRRFVEGMLFSGSASFDSVIDSWFDRLLPFEK